MNALEQRLQELKHTLSEFHASLADGTRALEEALAVIDVIETERELVLLRTVDIELAKSSFDRDAVLKLILRGALDLIHADYGDLLLPHDINFLRVESSSHDSIVGRLVPIEGSITGRAFRTGELQALPNVADTTDYVPLVSGMHSEVAVPLVESGYPMGVLNIESTEQGKFTEHHFSLLRTLAGQAAIAIRNSRLHSEFQALIETQARMLAGNWDLRELLAQIGSQARLLLNAEGCQLLTYKGGELSIEYTTGPESLGARVLVADSVSGLAIIRGEVINIDDVRLDPIAGPLYKDVLGDMRSEMVAPLLAGGEILGVINFESPRVAAFQGRQYLVHLFAQQAALAILNATRTGQVLTAQQEYSNLWATAQVGDIAANLVHQINSDVGAIRALIEEIRIKGAGVIRANPDVFARLDDMSRLATNALQIPQKLRSRLERASQTGVLDVNQVIRAVLGDMRTPEDVIMELDLAPDIPSISISLQCDELIKNLIQNSFDAMLDGGKVRIETRPWKVEFVHAGNPKPLVGVQIRISDTGCGIAPEAQKAIFSPGVSLKQSRSGLGFGLWWAKTFVDRAGGDITLDSAVGEGATFTIRLPSNATGSQPNSTETEKVNG